MEKTEKTEKVKKTKKTEKAKKSKISGKLSEEFSSCAPQRGELSPRRELLKLLHMCERKIYIHSSFGMRQTEILKNLLEGPTTQRELQQKMGIGAAALSELVSKLEKKSLVERRRSAKDRRVVELSISQGAAERVKNRVNEDVTAVDSVPLDEEEMAGLFALLKKLCDRYEEIDKSAREKSGLKCGAGENAGEDSAKSDAEGKVIGENESAAGSAGENIAEGENSGKMK